VATAAALVVVDTNVVVAGLITQDPSSPTVRTLDAMLSGSLMFLMSPELLACEPNAVLVTGDRMLLKKPYPGRVLMQPAEFWLRHP